MSLNDLAHLIHQLDGLPLLPCGYGPEGKAPIDPTTGRGLEGWESKAFTPDQILGFNGKVIAVGTRTGPAAGHLLIIDIDGRSAVEHCIAAGAYPKAAGWTIRRTTDRDRLKVAFYASEELIELLTDANGEPIGKRVMQTAAPVYDLDADGSPKRDEHGHLVKLKKQEAIELFYGTGQCLILGAHKPSGGEYVWDGSPINLTEPSDDWLAVIKDVLKANKVETKRLHAKGSGQTQQSGPGQPCVICGRHTSAACTTYNDGERVRINCYEGQTFNPRDAHGALKEGETVIGIDGNLYAYCGPLFNPSIGGFSKFAQHIDQPKPIPVAEPSGAAQGEESGEVTLCDTDWIKQQLRECLEEGLSAGEMAAEVDRIAVKADVHTSRVKDILAGLRSDEAAAEVVADVQEVIQQVEEAEATVRAISLEDFLPSKVSAALRTLQEGIPYLDITLLMAQVVHVSTCVKLGTRINGNPFTDWEVPANWFHIDVGPSGARKTPLISAVFKKPSTPIREQLNALNAQRFQAWEEECAGKKNGAKPPAPIALVHSTDSYTGEALTERLEVHEQYKQPLFIQRDEISGLFDSWGKYKQGGKGSGGDEQQLLELFDGGGHSSIRVGRGRSYGSCHVSMHGGMQNALLRRLLASGDDNGKWARCSFGPLLEMTYRLPVVTDAAITRRIKAERVLKEITLSLFKAAPKTYYLDAAGIQQLSDYDHLCQLQRNESRVPAIKALKNKAAGKALRMACLLHLLHCETDNNFPETVPVERLASAITLVEALDAWTASFHATAALDAKEADALADRNRIAERLHSIAAKHKGYVSWTTIRNTLRSSEKKGISSHMARVVFKQLCDLGIGITREGKRGGIEYRALGSYPQKGVPLVPFSSPL